jgi:Tol biopolymer transport system component
VIRRGLIVATFVLALVAVPVSGAAVGATGPRLALMSLGGRPIRFELLGVGMDGKEQVSIVRAAGRKLPAPYPFSPPSWSPDGSTLVFTGIVGQVHQRFYSGPQTMLFLVAADGSDLRAIPGTIDGAGPVFSPDGRTIAFAKERKRFRPNGRGGGDLAYESGSTWLVDLGGGAARQLTPWRNHLSNIPSSFSPDGGTLALTRRTRIGATEAIGINLGSGTATTLARNAEDPVYSPDGSQIAFLRGPRRTVGRPGDTLTATFTDLFVTGADGSGLLRLTNTRNALELLPSWDPSGQRIAFTHIGNLTSDSALFGFGDSIAEINRDGTCLTSVLSDPRVGYFGSSWQPGPGREAGPIAC